MSYPGYTRPSRRGAKTFAVFFVIQFLNYALLCWNYRAVAQARYGSIAVSDCLVAALTFKLIKRVSMSRSNAAMAGYVLGGVCGSLASVWVTRRLFGA